MTRMGLVCLMLAVGALVVAEEVPDKTQVRLMSMQVVRPEEAEEEDMPFGESGITLSFRADNKEKQIVGIDEEASAINLFVDERNTVLAKPKAGLLGRLLGGEGDGTCVRNTQTSRDLHRCRFEVYTCSLPAPGATRLILNANVVFLFGKDEKTVEAKDFPLEVGKDAKAGPFRIEVRGVGEGEGIFGADDAAGPEAGAVPQKDKEDEKDAAGAADEKEKAQEDADRRVDFGVVVAVHWTEKRKEKTSPRLKSVAFVDADGREVESQPAGSESEENEKESKRAETYYLNAKAGKVTVKVTYFESVDRVTVPVVVDTGVGF